LSRFLVLSYAHVKEAREMQLFLYVLLATAFVLGVLFIQAYRRRGGRPSNVSETGSTTSIEYLEANRESARRVAEAEAASIRQLAQTEADGLRRTASTEAEATRRAARSDAASLTAAAEAAVANAQRQAAAVIAEAIRRGEAEQARLTEANRREERELAAQSLRQAELDSQLEERATQLTAQSAVLEQTKAQLAVRDGELAELDAALRTRAGEIDARTADQVRELERIAGLSVESAKGELMALVESDSRRDAALLVRSIETEARLDGNSRARAIIADSLQRVASAQTAETVVSVLHLPGDDMKGRIIGREGRNIRAFEAVTGVNVIIDDTPEAVLLSCFDPVRREVGRLTLEKLIVDGRIHPHRIEEIYEVSKIEVEELCLRAARDALTEVGIHDLDEHLLPTLGRLKYRTSYGQNVLGHLTETAHIAGLMAAELGVEPNLIRRCAFLHDIGKALTHEVEGSHAIVGADLLRKYGESEAVVHAVEAHHNEVAPRTVEAVLTQASDTCSASRPGARRESVETYVKRLNRIEAIAAERPGVDKVYAMQAGREVRVMVAPGEIDDLGAQVIAREIAKQIEDELTYPGQIRVTVVRESRASEIAH
jgi:ribonuclease Y